MNKIDIKCIAQKGAVIPQYKTCGAAGADLFESRQGLIPLVSLHCGGAGLFAVYVSAF